MMLTIGTWNWETHRQSSDHVGNGATPFNFGDHPKNYKKNTWNMTVRLLSRQKNMFCFLRNFVILEFYLMINFGVDEEKILKP